MAKSYNQTEIIDDVLKALSAIEGRVKKAMTISAGVPPSNQGLKNCNKILDTCAVQLKALEIIGLSNNAQYYKVRNMLITANLVVDSASTQEKTEGSRRWTLFLDKLSLKVNR